MTLTPGTKLGPYEIQSLLGAGGMGEVYRARDTRLERDVAIKVLPAHLSSDPDLKQRMKREAKAISSLNHRIFARCTISARRTASIFLSWSIWKAKRLPTACKEDPFRWTRR
jgi:serine/threonine protein kinase